ncbi:MAG: ABC transporter ATP-binding protein [Fibrobacterota bacterium]
MATVNLKNICKTYKGDRGMVDAVKNFNLSIKDKEFVVFVGPSGCGKSTTLRMLAGLEEITSGDIFIDDRKVNDVPPKDRDIAMVFQSYALYPHMNVYKNLAFGLKLRKFPKDEIDARVKRAAEILGITDIIDRRPSQLSGGQQQRVALGRAIVRDAKVFLLDEPLSNLDAKLRVEMRAELSRLHNRIQSTMIYVTHDQVEAMTLGDRIVIMLDGVVQQCDKPINIYDYPVNKFVAGFIGTPAMNFLEGKLDKENDEPIFILGGEKISLPSALFEKVQDYLGKDIFLGIRPEDIIVENGSKNPNKGIGMSITSNIEVIERLGDEMIIHSTVEGQKMIYKEDSHFSVEVNSKLKLDFMKDKIHLFDHENGKNLIYGEEYTG